MGNDNTTAEGPVTQTPRELTFGEKAVGLTFNPGGNPDVNEIKKASAELINLLHLLRGDERSERAAMYTIAIRAIQDGQMWGVKAATWRE